MAVGQHLKKDDWNGLAFGLLQAYQHFSELAQKLAGYVAPYNATDFAALTGFSLQESIDLISGINVADKLRQVSIVNGTPDLASCATASQAAVALGKFGGA